MSPDAVEFGNANEYPIKIQNGTFAWEKNSETSTISKFVTSIKSDFDSLKFIPIFSDLLYHIISNM